MAFEARVGKYRTDISAEVDTGTRRLRCSENTLNARAEKNQAQVNENRSVRHWAFIQNKGSGFALFYTKMGGVAPGAAGKQDWIRLIAQTLRSPR